jgi:peptidoglycan hydrolase-like protein with peptidoglycan-binding domain
MVAAMSANMSTKRAGIVIGLIAAMLPLFAAVAPAKTPPKKAHAAAVKEAKADHAAAAANAGLPEADRLAIQADLAWLGDFDGTAGGDFDDKTLASLRAFQQRHSGKATGTLSAEERSALGNAARPHQDAVGWRVIDDPATGAAFGLPGKLVAPGAPSRNGSRWTSAHGQIAIETFRLNEAALPALFDDEKKTRRRTIEHSTLKPDSFVISGMQGLKKFVMRTQANGSELRGITIFYDQATEGLMGPAAIAIADTFQGFPDPNAVSSLGVTRSVEYGTALVVSSHGDLLTTAQLTRQCQSLTVPNIGHAERIAADDGADLALLRLYGAADLPPAALAGPSNPEGDLTLIGIADPRIASADQAGGSSVTHTPARVSAQGLEPPPPLGFSGAPAIDARGALAGLVDLRRPDAAAGAVAADPTTLIPLDAIRSFLAAQGIKPAAGQTASDQSVVRIICVR